MPNSKPNNATRIAWQVKYIHQICSGRYHQFRTDGNAVFDGSRHRAEIDMHIMHPFGRIDMVFFDFEEIVDMDVPDQEHFSIFADLTGGFRAKPSLACGYIARLQRAAKGARQSAGGCGHHVVERRGGGLEALRINAVMRCDLRVHPKHHRFFGLRKIGAADRAAQAFDGTMRSVNNVVDHGSSSVVLTIGQVFSAGTGQQRGYRLPSRNAIQ
jgi:hypothetical protein